jgi:hypothetical protein
MPGFRLMHGLISAFPQLDKLILRLDDKLGYGKIASSEKYWDMLGR